MPEAYQRLLLDVMQGDPSLFARADEVEQAWGIIDPIEAAWRETAHPPVALYERAVGARPIPPPGCASSSASGSTRVPC